MSASAEDKKETLKRFGLNEKGATDALKNAELTNLLVTLDEKFGASHRCSLYSRTKGLWHGSCCMQWQPRPRLTLTGVC